MNKNNELLAQIIVDELKKEFAIKHLSKNLVNTIKVIPSLDEVRVEIPAQIYDMLKFKKEGVVVYDRLKGSYASQLDESGSMFGNHKGYIDSVISKSIQRFAVESNQKIEKIEDTNGH